MDRAESLVALYVVSSGDRMVNVKGSTKKNIEETVGAWGAARKTLNGLREVQEAKEAKEATEATEATEEMEGTEKKEGRGVDTAAAAAAAAVAAAAAAAAKLPSRQECAVVFQAAQNEIVNLMARDTFPRFRAEHPAEEDHVVRRREEKRGEERRERRREEREGREMCILCVVCVVCVCEAETCIRLLDPTCRGLYHML